MLRFIAENLGKVAKASVDVLEDIYEEVTDIPAALVRGYQDGFGSTEESETSQQEESKKTTKRGVDFPPQT